MINFYFLDAGPFPDIAFFNGDVWAIVQPNATTLKLYREDKPVADIPCQSDLAFPRLHAFQNHLWLAYRDDVEGGKLHNLSLGVESVFAPHVDGNSPILLERGRVVWQESGRVRWLALDRLNAEPNDARFETRPTGLSRLNTDGFPIFADDDRFLVHGTTVPTFAGPLSASERHDSGALILDAVNKKALTLWPGLDSFNPRIIELPDGEFAVAAWGSRTARVATFQMTDLRPLAVPSPPSDPPPPPLPPLPPKKDMPTAPVRLSVVQQVIRDLVHVNPLADGERGQITDEVVRRLGGRPWGRKDRDRNPTNNNNSDDALCYLLPDDRFEIYDIIAGTDGSATWDYKGTFADGENGYFRDVPSIVRPDDPPPPPPPPPVERLDLTPLLAKFDELSRRNDAALQAATLLIVQTIQKAVSDVKSGVKVKF